MPHSSGGGSHSGGFHSGGSFSGGSHSGSSHSAPPAPSVSRRPYPGATRYVYYIPGAMRPRYLYYKGTPKKPELSSVIISLIVVTLIALPIMYLFFDMGVFIPQKIDLRSYTQGEVLMDTADVITDDAAVEAALLHFADTTGVTPAVEIVTDSDWKDYRSLETYAYNEYLRLYDDECHWLFVISFPGTSTDGFTDWQFEGMIGDNVGETVSSEAEDAVGELMQKYLIRTGEADIGSGLVQVFTEAEGIVMQQRIDYVCVFLIAVAALIYLLVVLAIIKDYQNAKALYGKAIPTAGKAQELKCEYCGCVYVQGTVTNCPHCGAGIKSIEPQE